MNCGESGIGIFVGFRTVSVDISSLDKRTQLEKTNHHHNWTDMANDSRTSAAKTTTEPAQPKPAMGITDDHLKSPVKSSDGGNGTPENVQVLNTFQSADHGSRDEQAEVGVVNGPGEQKYGSDEDFLFFCFQPLSW